MRALSIAKFEDGIMNEDATKATSKWIAVSDGAGGGGVFADKWSKYLVEHLPDGPIANYQSFDAWIDGIWEPFYNDCEKEAMQEGGMLLNKFYDEGSFATLAAVWDNGHWVSYGDSVVFCFDRKTGLLQHSFGRMVEFNNPPYLVNCKEPTDEKGFKTGIFENHKDCLIFAASDTLAHYIIMMYEVFHKNKFEDEIQEAIIAQTKNSNFINTALQLERFVFIKDVLDKLLSSSKNKGNFKRHLQSLRKKGLIGHDDYSFAVLKSQE